MFDLKKYHEMCYHGTARSDAKKILEINRFQESKGDDHWLGEGIYFFEKDAGQARDFIRKAKGVKEYSVIEAEIESEKLLDLMDKDTYLGLCRLCEKLSDRLKETSKKGNTIKAKGEITNTIALNAAYNVIPFEVVRASFETPKSKKIKGITFIPVQIQVCVKEPKVIVRIKEMSSV